MTAIVRHRLVHRETEIARLALQDEVEGLQMKLAQVLDGTAASVNEYSLRCEPQSPFLSRPYWTRATTCRARRTACLPLTSL